MNDSIRCLFCGDLFVPEDDLLPVHYLDINGEAPRCAGRMAWEPK